ncbi:MAG: Shikimate 5-dehydrogenase alpha [Myxococcaceae bacterium]|nr:Shikimate 5-dehydrogenase alpha [Myxococcaceae bacterium]
MTPLRFAVIGDPVGHTKSPRMHAAAYAALGLPHVYEALPTKDDEVGARVQALRDSVYAGLNVTVPHKQRVLDYVDAVDMSAQAVGAANTLVRDVNGSVVAFNTDVPALAAELRRLAPARTTEAWAESDALVLGSGGAARAALVALGVVGVRRICVRARNVERASALIELLPKAGCEAAVRLEPLVAKDDDGAFTTIVQATSAGMVGAADGHAIAGAVDWERLPTHAIALDVVYAPPETPFLSRAYARGLRGENGLGMLAGQGALAFAMWLGTEPPIDAMLAALAP